MEGGGGLGQTKKRSGIWQWSRAGGIYVLKQIDGYRQKDSQTEDRKMDRRNKSLIEELRS